jgi:H+/Cl- antiporter ClcA
MLFDWIVLGIAIGFFGFVLYTFWEAWMLRKRPWMRLWVLCGMPLYVLGSAFSLYALLHDNRANVQVHWELLLFEMLSIGAVAVNTKYRKDPQETS